MIFGGVCMPIIMDDELRTVGGRIKWVRRQQNLKIKDFSALLGISANYLSLLEHGNRHSAHIHSKNIDNITKYARAIDTAILVKNAPSYAAIGFGGEGFCTFTIASRTGEGLTSASTFTKRRRCVMSDSLCIR